MIFPVRSRNWYTPGANGSNAACSRGGSAVCSFASVIAAKLAIILQKAPRAPQKAAPERPENGMHGDKTRNTVYSKYKHS